MYGHYPAQQQQQYAYNQQQQWWPNQGGQAYTYPAESQNASSEPESSSTQQENRSPKLPVNGNQETMNLQTILLSSIQASEYFKAL